MAGVSEVLVWGELMDTGGARGTDWALWERKKEQSLMHSHLCWNLGFCDGAGSLRQVIALQHLPLHKANNSRRVKEVSTHWGLMFLRETAPGTAHRLLAPEWEGSTDMASFTGPQWRCSQFRAQLGLERPGSPPGSCPHVSLCQIRAYR